MALHLVPRGKVPQQNLELSNRMSLSSQLALGRLLSLSSQLKDGGTASERGNDLLK